MADHNERHGVGGVSGERGNAVCVEHLVNVAVVGGDQALTAHLEDRVNDLAYAVVGRFDRLDGCLEHAGMADHVAVCKVQDDNVVLAGQDALDALLGDSRLAHLRLKVIGRDLGRRNQSTVLARILLLDAAVEEERNMCVLLGLSNAQLGHAQIGDILAEGVLEALRLEGDLYARNGRIILRHADIMDLGLYALETGEFRIDEGTGDLACAVGSEVCEDDRVIVADGRALGHDDRNDELVGNAVGVGLLHRLMRGSGVLALAERDRLVCLLYAVPAVVAVHCVVAAGYGRDAADLDGVDLGLQAVDILDAGLRRRVAAVHEAVEAYLAQTVAARELEQREHMVNVGVNAAVGQEAEDVQGGIEPLALVDGAHQSRVLEEIAVLNRLGDAGQLLIYDAACTDIGVTDLGVAHLAVRQTDVHTGCADIGQRIFREDPVEIRLVCGLDRIALLLRTVAEAVHDDQSGRLLRAFRLLGSAPAGRGLFLGRRLCGGLAAALGCRLCCALCLSLGLAAALRLGRLLSLDNDRVRQNVYRYSLFCCVGSARRGGLFNHSCDSFSEVKTDRKGQRYLSLPPSSRLAREDFPLPRSTRFNY